MTVTKSKETYEDILRLFKERYNIKKINDYRPAPFDFEDSRKAGIKVWFDNGDEIIFIPKEWKELNEERLKRVRDMGLEDAYHQVAKECRKKYDEKE